MSQQAPLKRIPRLEFTLGRRLLNRGGQGVRLTEAGRRFLEPTRQALAAADLAVAAVPDTHGPLRIEVWEPPVRPTPCWGRRRSTRHSSACPLERY
ncbi:LysR family transcriptional regulator [Nonomuraea rubra]|uniref:LysR family transcriptional regulator n=1 Tax=Nonomuraea rubra TaxID=46180 RepID=UPI0033F66066